MSLIQYALKDTCIYWAPNGFNSQGTPAFEPPLQIPCRWVATSSLQALTDERDIKYKDRIRLLYPVVAGGYLKKGVMGDIIPGVPPLKASGAGRIHETQELKDFYHHTEVRIAWL